MKKKYILIPIFIFLLIIIFFVKFNYKNFKSGNNKNNKSVNEAKEYILNIGSYTATIDVTVQSNKNCNKYLLKQIYNENEKVQEVLKPENIEGIEIKYSNNALQISNSKLNLNKIYNNYPYISDNSLWLSSFVEEYKKSNNSEIYEEKNNIVMKVTNDSKYCRCKKLYLQKGTGKPEKMIIQDDSNNDKIYILYNEINIY